MKTRLRWISTKKEVKQKIKYWLSKEHLSDVFFGSFLENKKERHAYQISNALVLIWMVPAIFAIALSLLIKNPLIRLFGILLSLTIVTVTELYAGYWTIKHRLCAFDDFFYFANKKINRKNNFAEGKLAFVIGVFHLIFGLIILLIMIFFMHYFGFIGDFES